MTLSADIVDSGFAFAVSHEVSSVQYAAGRLNIELQALDGTVKIAVTFPEVAGFRVLDEGDLLEFWTACSGKGNWIFEIKSGGWFEQEAQRAGFIRRNVRAIKEPLITGADSCVSVLAWDVPKVSRHAV